MPAVRTRSCKRCKSTGYLNRWHRGNRVVKGPMGDVTMPDKTPCPYCCLHSGEKTIVPVPYQPNLFETPAEYEEVVCARCGSLVERRPLPSQTPAKAPEPAPAPTPPSEPVTGHSGPLRASGRRRKLARPARAPSKPGFTPSSTKSTRPHINLHFASLWNDTVKGTVRWKARSTTERGTLNMGIDLERPLRMKDGGETKHDFVIISVRENGTIHPPWVSIVEEA